MSATKEAAAINGANAMIQLAQQIANLRASINAFVTQYSDEGFSTVWSNLATAALNTDGSPGTVDGSPNTTHPIDTRATANSGLSKAVSQTQLVNGVSMLEQMQNFFTNVAVTQNNYIGTIDDLAS